ncbi:non-homologous end-joining DNA ligase [Paenactinomyces guangxiensis]|uniref:DNA polymerase domain-containing protein n=1 Tax=Paenactinomyces guangxiensis TaxID=1490290 RepID=A0A7W1WSG3_9BACL|nr:non-homologous end-joining DNA ligase [Paenactinomyces guangxiensis]MBA4495148.1 DNA polymerase domain-containing protein [Paenactinomyces guangxiensis]MBH8592168.1 non-homologous end-joining DNA ligase [Paenactinomyces guangxiensis]
MSQYRLVQIDGVEIKISNPDKLLFPQANISKWDYVLSCTRLAPFLLPYCKDRHLTTIRYPDGVNNESFFQKNAPAHRPEWVMTKTEGDIEYILLNNTPTLIWLANLACLEFHVSFNVANNPNRPSEVVFDLDPSTDDFSRVVEVALYTREILHQMDLDGVVKTSGASGLQVYVPIEPEYCYEDTRKVNRFIAYYLAEQYPDLITIERRVQHRGDKVYFDYLQHWKNKTLIAPYSPRGKPEATVSTPLKWEELTPALSPKQWTLATVFQRLEQLGDLFQPVYRGPRYVLEPILKFIERHKL